MLIGLTPGRPFTAFLRALGMLLLGAVATLGVAAVPAAAHDTLVSTSPAEGATVTRAPGRVMLTFDQPALALGTALVVTDSAGQPVQAGAPRLVDNTVSQELQPAIPAGEYLVTWRVTSVDGHPITGRFTFTATASAGEAADPGSTPAAPTTTDQQPAREGVPGWALILGVLVVLGVLLAGLRRVARRQPSPPAE